MNPRRCAAVALLAGLTSCQVPTAPFYGRTFFCDGTLPAEGCGTTPTGEQMVCYKARQIGARDFCTERCAAGTADAAGPGWRCVDTKARLRSCKPSAGDQACPADTECLRTDAVADEGVCMTMSTCASDGDCKDPARSTCMGGLLRNWYGAAAGISTDRWSCLQTGCKAHNAACSPGESCLPMRLPESAPLDICVPNCDSDLNCPPNYFCFRKVSGAAAEAVCIPGIMGFRCTSDMDCLLGACVDNGEGFKLCAVPCQTHNDCLRFGVTRGAFVCAEAPGGKGHFCQNPRAYAGSPCRADKDCREHEACIDRSPFFGTAMSVPECRPRCGPDLPCKNRGGVPHVCVELAGVSSCYPGRLHLPCTKDTDCVGTLQCLEVAAPDYQDQVNVTLRCSAECRTDADCAAHPYADGQSYCRGGRCASKLHPGLICEQDSQCLEAVCTAEAPDGGAPVKRCRRPR